MARKQNPHKSVIAANIVKFRDALGITQQQLAEAADIPLDNLRRYEREETAPGADVMRSLGFVLGHTIEHFMQPDPPPADLSHRPAFYFRVMPGVTPDAGLVSEASEAIEKVNAKSMKERKPKRR